MNKKAISILLTAAMGVSVLAAGTVTVSAAEKKDKYVIGMSQCNLGEPWRVAMNDQIAMAAEKHPEFEVIFADAAQDNSQQIADIENFVQMGVDLIITSPNEATPLTNAVSAAYDAGIPVILLDRKIDGDKYTQFIGADNVDMGRIAGEYIADTLLPDGGKVCEIKGLEGTSGGIFLPLLVLGAFIGAIFGSVVIPIFGLESYLIYKFIVISMAGFFAATVRSPITGVVLLSEMCGSTESLVAMLIVAIIAYAVPMLLNNRPIYESLFERLLAKNNHDFIKDHSKHILSEYVVPSGWKYTGKPIKDIPFPKGCIVVSITRGGDYILADEDITINYADQIHMLMDSKTYPFKNDEMGELMSKVIQ